MFTIYIQGGGQGVNYVPLKSFDTEKQFNAGLRKTANYLESMGIVYDTENLPREVTFYVRGYK